MPTDITLTDEELRLVQGALLIAGLRARTRVSDLEKLTGLLSDLQADQQMASLLAEKPKFDQPGWGIADEPVAASALPSWQPMDKSLPGVGAWAVVAWAGQYWDMWFVQRTESGWLNREGGTIVFDNLAGRLWHPISPLPTKGAKL